MLRVGLCGGLGSGKSTVGLLLALRGAVVVDADQVARDVVAPGTPGLQAVLSRFGPGVGAPGGGLDRGALARLVFADPVQRKALEGLIHPLIRSEVEARLQAAEEAGAQVAVIELPLLDGTRRAQYALDCVVVVDAPEDLSVRRAMGRGWSEAEVRARMAAQPSDEDRRKVADWVLANSGSRDELRDRVDDLWEWLLARVAPG
jgi:dephospho-CoA kinase